MIDRLAARRLLVRARLAVARRRLRYLKFGGGTRCFDLSDDFDGVRAIMFEDGMESCVKWSPGGGPVRVDRVLVGDEFSLAQLIHEEDFAEMSAKRTGVVEIDSREWPVTIAIRTSDEGLLCYTLESVAARKERYSASATSIVECRLLYVDPLRPVAASQGQPLAMAGVRYTKDGPRARRYLRDPKFEARLRESDYGKWSERICKPLI